MRATTGGLGARRGAPAAIPVAFVRPLLRHLLSFEMVFALYLYSNRFEPVLPPLPFDTTPLFAGLTVAGIGYLVATGGIYTRGLPVVVAGLAFVAWVALSATWSPSRVLASYTVTYLATFNLMCVAAGALVVARSRERVVRLLVLVTLFSLLLAVWGIAIYLAYGSFRFAFAELGLEAGRMYLNWGYGASSGAVVAFCVTTYARFGSRAQLLGAATFCVILVFLLVSSGRGPLLSVALVCLALLLLGGLDLSDRRRLGARVSVLAAAALVAAATGYVAYLVASGQSVATLDRFAKLMAEAENPDLIQGPNRFRYWAAALQLWYQAPLVGHGAGSFSMLFISREVQGTHPHNIVLELLAMYGVAGFCLFALFVWSGVRYAPLRRLARDPLLVCVLLLFAQRLVAALYNSELPNQQPLFFFLALLALPPPAPPPRPADDSGGGEEPGGDGGGGPARRGGRRAAAR
jgi:O-antigen ligase